MKTESSATDRVTSASPSKLDRRRFLERTVAAAAVAPFLKTSRVAAADASAGTFSRKVKLGVVGAGVLRPGSGVRRHGPGRPAGVLGLPRWTNDSDPAGHGVECRSTARLLKELEGR